MTPWTRLVPGSIQPQIARHPAEIILATRINPARQKTGVPLRQNLLRHRNLRIRILLPWLPGGDQAKRGLHSNPTGRWFCGLT